MELQSGMAVAIASRMSGFQGRFSTRALAGQRDFAAMEQCGLSIGKKKALSARECRCDGVAGIGSALAMDWRPAFDEVLLMSSVLLAYVAGVVRPFGGVLGRKNNTAELPSSTRSSISQDQLPRKQASINDEAVWDGMNRKLVEAIARFEEVDQTLAVVPSNPKLCLQALAYAPRLRLLLAAMTLLRNETSGKEITLDDLFGLVGPVCRLWISQESEKNNANLSGYLSSSLIKAEDLGGDIEIEAREYMSTRLQRSGKAQLFQNILYHLCNKSSRRSRTALADRDFSTEFVANVLEDILVAVSDGAAAMYLGAIGVANTGWSTLLQQSICSTRSLERFRNEVALQQWIHYNFDSVAAIYEDRVELWGLIADKVQHEPDSGNKSRKKPKKQLSNELGLDRRSLRIRRSSELKALSGWRYCYSLYLEFSDVLGPLLRILVTKVGQGLSFLLVCLIGRSFGLIYQGIRQSVKWSNSSD